MGGACVECELASARKRSKYRYKDNPEIVWKHKIKNKYGISPEDYDRMFLEQKGVCKICGSLPDSKHGRLHIDHDHSTDTVRGLLCTQCNQGIGYFKDDPLRLELAAIYLRENGRF